LPDWLEQGDRLAETIMGLRKKQQGNVYIQGQERQINLQPMQSKISWDIYLKTVRDEESPAFRRSSNITLISLKNTHAS
jgi:ABC-type sugar transport system ATPase subunit